MFKKKYVVEVLYDSGATCKVVMYGTKKQIAKDLEYYKSKAYWWEDLGGSMVMKTNQPV